MGRKNKGNPAGLLTTIQEKAQDTLVEPSDSQNNKPAKVIDQPQSIDHFYKALPKVGGAIDADQFVAARMQEINSMQSSIKATSAALKLPSFKSQPRFLRRRAASHLLYHLRARDRTRLSAKLANGRIISPSLKKIKSKMLMDELISRKNNIKWLPTHKWHIKRMKMENWWGYRLSAHPMYKSRRITYRSFTKMALLHDASYQGCLQLHGSQDAIIELLNKFTDPFLPSVGSLRYTKGTRVGNSYFYGLNCYPAHLISPIQFLWRPSSAVNDAMLWLWMHPSSFDTIQQQIDQEATSMSKLDKTVNLQSLRKDLARFELTGPRSLALLQSILDPVEEHDGGQKSTLNCQMWRELQHLRSGCCLPNGTVIGLMVQDPRLRFPQKARPATASADMNAPTQASQDMLSKFMNWPTEASMSEIWDKATRDHCQNTKTTETRLRNRREHMPMPGSKLPYIPQEDSKIPVLLIQHNGPNQSPHTGSRYAYYADCAQSKQINIDSWTLVVPWAFGNSFWRSLVYAGARTGGLADIHNMHFDCGVACFPYDYPTTTAFEDYQGIIGAAEKEKWERRPPSKRLNHDKLGIVSPHQIPFGQFLKTSDDTGDMATGVLLQNDKLISIILDYNDENDVEQDLFDTMANAARARGMKTLFDTMVEAASAQGMTVSGQFLLKSMAVKIKLECERGGVMKSGARIYLIKDDDFAEDFINCRNKRQVKQLENVKPPNPDDLIGYVTTGGYSLVTGQGQGIGACSALGVYHIARQPKTIKWLVLVHNMTCREYTVARVSLL